MLLYNRSEPTRVYAWEGAPTEGMGPVSARWYVMSGRKRGKRGMAWTRVRGPYAEQAHAEKVLEGMRACRDRRNLRIWQA